MTNAFHLCICEASISNLNRRGRCHAECPSCSFYRFSSLRSIINERQLSPRRWRRNWWPPDAPTVFVPLFGSIFTYRGGRPSSSDFFASGIWLRRLTFIRSWFTGQPLRWTSNRPTTDWHTCMRLVFGWRWCRIGKELAVFGLNTKSSDHCHTHRHTYMCVCLCVYVCVCLCVFMWVFCISYVHNYIAYVALRAWRMLDKTQNGRQSIVL